MHIKSRFKYAFSLVELSIVLVILGLLAGAILVGKSLIHASEIRKVGTDIAGFRTAAFAFKDKYFAIPGDMINASSFWPSAVNGYGNGMLGWNLTGVNFWNHLQQAGLVSGNIAPVNSAISAVAIGTHVPLCPLGACGYSMVYFSGWVTQPQLVGRNILVMGSESPSNYTAGTLSNLTAEDVWNLDTKYDDGQADLGTYVGRNCISGTYPTRAYYLNNTSLPCAILIDFFR